MKRIRTRESRIDGVLHRVRGAELDQHEGAVEEKIPTIMWSMVESMHSQVKQKSDYFVKVSFGSTTACKQFRDQVGEDEASWTCCNHDRLINPLNYPAFRPNEFTNAAVNPFDVPYGKLRLPDQNTAGIFDLTDSKSVMVYFNNTRTHVKQIMHFLNTLSQYDDLPLKLLARDLRVPPFFVGIVPATPDGIISIYDQAPRKTVFFMQYMRHPEFNLQWLARALLEREDEVEKVLKVLSNVEDENIVATIANNCFGLEHEFIVQYMCDPEFDLPSLAHTLLERGYSMEKALEVLSHVNNNDLLSVIARDYYDPGCDLFESRRDQCEFVLRIFCIIKDRPMTEQLFHELCYGPEEGLQPRSALYFKIAGLTFDAKQLIEVANLEHERVEEIKGLKEENAELRLRIAEQEQEEEGETGPRFF